MWGTKYVAVKCGASFLIKKLSKILGSPTQ